MSVSSEGWRHRYAVLLACATLLLVIAGGLVTSTGSGLAVPDWPLSFGQVFPRMEGGVLFEHGHRLLAATVGLLTVILALWTRATESRAWVRRLAWLMVGAVVVQGLLGGTTVLLRLPDAVSVAHAGLAQLFFALTVVMAAATGERAQLHGRTGAPVTEAPIASTRALTLFTAFAIYVQILLGAIVRHTGAALAIPDFPLAFGRLVPAFTSSLVAWHYAHRIGALVVSLLVVWTSVRIALRHGREPELARPAILLVALIGLQVFLGALTILTLRAVVPTTAHVATGAALLATAVLLTVRAHQAPASADLLPPEAAAAPAAATR
jgi:cytochrome c oxidase assembly protein subunit 15